MKIAHIADIHIKNEVQPELIIAANNLIGSLNQTQPGLIVLVGDLFDNFIEISNEAKIFAGDFLNRLSEISEVIITRGNHDVRKKNKNRTDSIDAVVKLINNNRVHFFKKSEIIDYNNEIQFAVWDHLDKINPYLVNNNILNPNKLLIDLYHDPINGLFYENNLEIYSTKYISLNKFQGDIILAGDIHNQQYFYRDEKLVGGYCSSLIELKFSEGGYDDVPQFHGYLLWDTSNITVERIAIESGHGFNTFRVNQFTNFDNLYFKFNSNIKDDNSIRIIWATNPATFTNENKEKVEKYFTSLGINIRFFAHKKEFIIDDKSIISDNGFNVKNIINLDQQQSLINKYLEELGHEEALIKKVIDLDSKINTFLPNEDRNLREYSIVKIFGENFMSYGNIDLNFQEIPGITDIKGENQIGKTTIFKLIQYVFYGKSIETERAKQHGDSRFVNYLNNATYTKAGVVIESNGEYYAIIRETTIKYNRAKTQISSCPTTVEYYKLSGSNFSFNNFENVINLNEEEKIYTQKVISEILGTFEDFQKIVITTADTLNKVLSLNKSDFIDSILYYLGLDVCDKKLDLFKEYKKDYNSKNTPITIRPESHDLKINENLNKISENDLKFEEHQIEITKIADSIKKGEEHRNEVMLRFEKIDPELNSLNINSLSNDLALYKSNISLKLKQKNELLVKLGAVSNTFDPQEYQRVENEINNIKNQISESKNLKTSKTYEKEMLEFKINTSKGKIKQFDIQIAGINETIDTLKNSKTCYVCGNSIENKIPENVQKESDKINKIREQIVMIENEINEHNAGIGVVNNFITNLDNLLVELFTKNDKLLDDFGKLKNAKAEYESAKQIQVEIDKIPLVIENLELKIKTAEDRIKLFDLNKEKIEKNKKTQEYINLIDEKLSNYRRRYKELETICNKYVEANSILKFENERLNKEIVLFKKQEKIKEIFDIYESCMHRNGLPTKILKSYSIPMINSVLDSVLTNVSVDVWIDQDDMSLKFTNKFGVPNDAISGSGMEKTFSAIALKIALNKLNLKNRPTIFLLDEIMGKLDSQNTQFMFDLLTEQKSIIKNIFIIEQRLDFPTDNSIFVKRNKSNLSELSVL